MTNEMKDYLNDNMSVVTINTGDSNTFTLTDTVTDPLYADDLTVDINLNTIDDYFTTDTIVTGDWKSNEITVGDTKLDEDTVKKLKALLDVVEDLEDDNALKELYNAQVMLNKIKGKS